MSDENIDDVLDELDEEIDVEDEDDEEVEDEEVEDEEEVEEPEKRSTLAEILNVLDADDEESEVVSEEDLEEDEDAEDEDEDEEEDIEDESSILDDVDEDDALDENEDLLPEGFEDMTREEQDEEIFLAMEDDTTWAEWRQSAEQVHGSVDRSFAVEAARSGYDPQFLSERGIYSLGDFKDRIISEEAKHGEKAIVLTDPDDPEELAKFKEEYWGIPKDKDGYDLAGLKDTIYDGDEQSTALLLERAMRCSWTQGQLIEQATHATLVAEELDRRERGETNSYRRDQKETLKELYGENATAISKAAVALIKSSAAGQEFLKEHGQSKAVASANFYAMLHNILSKKMTSTDLSNLVNQPVDVKNKDLGQYSVDELEKQRNALQKSKAATREPESRAEEERHHRVWGAIAKLNREIGRRNRSS